MEGEVHRTWGYMDKKTGRISGMSGQLQRKEADIGGSNLICYFLTLLTLITSYIEYFFTKLGTIIFLTADRIDYLDYLSMTIPSTIVFVLRSPPISYVSNIYYLPFTGIVWICTISLAILCTLIIALTLKFHLSTDDATENLNASDYFLFVIASACQMGTDLATEVLSARISMVSHSKRI